MDSDKYLLRKILANLQVDSAFEGFISCARHEDSVVPKFYFQVATQKVNNA
jgi:hypothetical protein